MRAWEGGKPTCVLAHTSLADHAACSAAPRFAEVETVVVLTVLMARHKVEVTEEPQFAGETFEECKARVLSVFTVITTM